MSVFYLFKSNNNCNDLKQIRHRWDETHFRGSPKTLLNIQDRYYFKNSWELETISSKYLVFIWYCALLFLSEELSEHCFIKTRTTKNWEHEEHDQTDKHWKFVQITFVSFFICINTLLDLYRDCHLWSYDCHLLLYIVSYYDRKVLVTILK